MPYGMTDEEYAREVDRKSAAGIPLTQPFNAEAYARGKAAMAAAAAPSTPSAPAAAPSPPSEVYQAVREARPTVLTVYNPPYQPGKTVDLTPLLQAIGSGPRQVSVPTPQTPQVFGLEQIQEAIRAQQQAGISPQVQQARFQTPTQLGQIVSQLMQILQPYTRSQQQAAQTGFGQALDTLRNTWAARGLLASGAAASQERQAAENLAQQLANIEAQQLANAVPWALQYGQLSLQEAGQIFNQLANIRDFEQARAQQAVANLLAALGQQEAMRQFEQTFGLDVERLRSQEFQNYLDQLARYYGLETGQSQWAQEFGLERQAQDFNRWLQTQQLNQAAMNNWLNNLVSAGTLAQRATEFQQTLPLQIAELTGDYMGTKTLAARELEMQDQQRQIDNALSRTQVLGFVTPQDSVILGVPSGTPYWQAAEAAADRKARLEIERAQLALERRRVAQAGAEINWLNRMRELEYQKALKEYQEEENLEKSVKDIQSIFGTDRTTAEAVYYLWQNPTRESALADLQTNRSALAKQGVNVDVLRRAIDHKWPVTTVTSQQPATGTPWYQTLWRALFGR